MPRRGGSDVAVGAMFALALVILALAIMAVGEEARLFSSKAQYGAVFPSADGLRVGSPVKMAGVQIGTVTDINLPTDPGQQGIETLLGVDRAYAPRVREDSTAGMRILLYLSGEKYVEITAGSPEAPPLAEGSQIPLTGESELFAQGEAIAENLTDITLSLKDILDDLSSGQGLLGQMMSDPDFGREGLESLGATIDNLERLTADLTRSRPAGFGGEGPVGRLLYDEELAGKFDRLGQAIDSLATVAEAIERGDGAVGVLLAEDGSAERALDDFAAAAGSLRRTTERLESGEGLLGRLLHDEAWSEELAGDLGATLDNLAEVTGKLRRGEGTLGALLNERSVYDGAEDVLAGANDSKFARWLLRHLRKKGIKAEEREREDEHEDEGEGEGDGP